MQTSFKALAIILLLMNGVSACYGGWKLIADPSGESMQMPLDLLAHAPFSSFVIPGIILFVTNGISSLIVTYAVITRTRFYELFIFGQGCLLSAWIIIQVLMIRVYHPLQLVYFLVGVSLIVIGIYLFRKRIFKVIKKSQVSIRQ
jgi:uncharacterized membrane protein